MCCAVLQFAKGRYTSQGVKIRQFTIQPAGRPKHVVMNNLDGLCDFCCRFNIMIKRSSYRNLPLTGGGLTSGHKTLDFAMSCLDVKPSKSIKVKNRYKSKVCLYIYPKYPILMSNNPTGAWCTGKLKV